MNYLIRINIAFLLLASSIFAENHRDLSPQKSDLVLLPVNPISAQPILPDTPIKKIKTKPSLQLTSTRGEYEPASFVIYNPSDEAVTVEISHTELTSPSDIIRNDNVDIKHVIVWNQAANAWNHWKKALQDKSAVMVPELIANDSSIIRADHMHNYIKISNGEEISYKLISDRENKLERNSLIGVRDKEKLSSVKVPPQSNHQIWITTYTPSDASAGIYKSRISVTNLDNREVTYIPLELKVLPFSLPRPKIEFSIYYLGILHSGALSISAKTKSSNQLLSDLKALKEHGISNPTCYQPLYDKDHTRDKSTISPLLIEHLDLRKEAGISTNALYYLGVIADSRPQSKLKDDVRMMKFISNRYQIKELYIYGKDEVHGSELLKQQSFWNTAKSEGAKIFAAGRKNHAQLTGGATNLLIYKGSSALQNQQTIEYQSRRNNRTFIYSDPQSGPENPLIWREHYGIKAWRDGFDGVMPFAYQWPGDDIWNDWSHRHYRSHALAYPTATKPISTLAFEGLREAVDDIRYLTLLENLMTDATQTQNTTQHTLINDVKNFFRDIQRNKITNADGMRMEAEHYILALLQ